MTFDPGVHRGGLDQEAPLYTREQDIMPLLSADIYHKAASVIERLYGTRAADLEIKKYIQPNVHTINLPPSIEDLFVSDPPEHLSVEFMSETDNRPSVKVHLKSSTGRAVTLTRSGDTRPEDVFKFVLELPSEDGFSGSIPGEEVNLLVSTLALGPSIRNTEILRECAQLDIQDHVIAGLLERTMYATLPSESFVAFTDMPVPGEDDTYISISCATDVDGSSNYQVKLRKGDRLKMQLIDEVTLDLPANEQDGLGYFLSTYMHGREVFSQFSSEYVTEEQSECTTASILSMLLAALEITKTPKVALISYEEIQARQLAIDDALSAPEESDISDSLIVTTHIPALADTYNAALQTVIDDSYIESDTYLEQ